MCKPSPLLPRRRLLAFSYHGNPDQNQALDMVIEGPGGDPQQDDGDKCGGYGSPCIGQPRVVPQRQRQASGAGPGGVETDKKRGRDQGDTDRKVRASQQSRVSGCCDGSAQHNRCGEGSKEEDGKTQHQQDCRAERDDQASTVA